MLGLVATSGAQATVPLVSTRMGAGPSLIQSPAQKSSSWTSFGSCRFAALEERLHLFAGIDLTTWRIAQVTSAQNLKKNMMGNELLFILGHTQGPWSSWAGLGAGQIRVAEPTAEDKNEMRRFLANTMNLGASYDIYQAEHGKIDTSITWRHVLADKNWRSTYSLTMIDAVQFEIGFKLLGW
ncbi:MAG: hypothetical protein NTX25_01525 [Proteobacteria bacterium]|nr:hypothetical protein [Pseudomonadota bacterium]